MKQDEVPQDASPVYIGQRRLLYAVDEQGNYGEARSSGWEVETEATMAAVREIERQRDDAWARGRRGEAAPLEFHMFRRRMDIALLAQTSGFWQWRVRRHLRPAVFARLSRRALERYAEALGLSMAELQQLPPSPDIR